MNDGHGPVRGRGMTIGQLSRRTGVPVTALRRHEGMGLIRTLGRSAGGYRLFDESAIGCVHAVRELRALGLTEAEIAELADAYRTGRDIRTHVADVLDAVRGRLEARATLLAAQRRRLEEFEARYHAGLDAVDGCPLPSGAGSAA